MLLIPKPGTPCSRGRVSREPFKRYTVRQISCRFGARNYHSEYNPVSALLVEPLRLISVLLGEHSQRSRSWNVVTGGALYVCVCVVRMYRLYLNASLVAFLHQRIYPDGNESVGRHWARWFQPFTRYPRTYSHHFICSRVATPPLTRASNHHCLSCCHLLSINVCLLLRLGPALL